MQYASRARRARVRPTVLLALAGLSAVVFSAESRAQQLYVICHPSVSLMPTDLRDVFLGDKQFTGGIALSLADNGAAREIFLQKVLKMDTAKYLTSWTKKAFRDGVNPPSLSGDDAEALEYVKRGPGRCSYVTTPPGPGVAIIAVY
jgi:hypothetical protein